MSRRNTSIVSPRATFPENPRSYNGDFIEIKNNLNQCIDGLGGLVEANAVLQRMTTNDYSVQVKGQYQGVFAEVGHAVNEVQERINHVIATVTLVSRGDLKDLESYRQIGNGKGRRSDNDELVSVSHQNMIYQETCR